MDAVAFRRRTAGRTYGGVRCLSEWRTGASYWPSPSGRLRRDLLRVARWGLQAPGDMQSTLPRTYLVAGTEEPFFQENATRWADALRDADADVVITERPGSHGDPFWRDELPLMAAWA